MSGLIDTDTGLTFGTGLEFQTAIGGAGLGIVTDQINGLEFFWGAEELLWNAQSLSWAPVAITLSATTAPDSATAGTVVGALAVVSGGAGPFTFLLSNNANGQFAISGSNLVVGSTALNHTTNPTATITVRATDGLGTTLFQSFTISIYSYAMYQLNLKGGVGLFASWQYDSVAIVDPGTPANNYDGNFAGKFTLVGSPTTGANGGMLVQSSTEKATLAVTKFPWNHLVGTLGGQMVRLSNGATFSQYIAINSVVLRSGATMAVFRAEVGGLGNTDSIGTRFYPDVRHQIGYCWSSDITAAIYDGQYPTANSGGTCTAGDTTLVLGGSGNGTGDYAEILDAWYIPTAMSASALQAATVLADPRDFYANSATGNDSNNGLSPAAAKLTIGNLIADATGVRYGDNIWMQGRFFETVLNIPAYCPTSSYGGGYAILDGSTLVSPASWTVNGTYANVYQYTATQTVSGSQPFYPSLWFGDAGLNADPLNCRATSTTSTAIATGSKTFTVQTGKAFQAGNPVRVWQSSNRSNFMFGLVTAYSDDQLTVNVVDTGGSGTIASWVVNLTSSLNGYWGGATVADNITFVAAHPGRFTSDPNTGPAASVTYYINPPDSTAPSVSNTSIYYGQHASVANIADGGNLFTGFTIQRTATKDMVTRPNHSDLYLQTTNMRLLDAAAHAVVAAPSIHTNGYARGQDSSISGAGGLWHFFHDTSVNGPSSPCSATNCVGQNGGLGFYSHGNQAGVVPNQSVAILNGQMVDCAVAAEPGGNFEGLGLWTFVNCVRTNSGAYHEPGNDPDIFINSP